MLVRSEIEGGHAEKVSKEQEAKAKILQGILNVNTIETDTSKSECTIDLTKMSTCKERCMAQLTCPICTELFVEATLLSCTHIFCHDCIESWNREQKNRACPVCSKPVTSMIRATGLDDLIESMIADFRDFPPELKNKRKERMQEREASEKKA